MSHRDEPTTGIDPLQELGKQLPWDRPDAARREAVRSSLLVAASDAPPRRANRSLLVGASFVAGALAAAAVALLVVRASPSSPSPSPAHDSYAQIESSSVAELEHTSTRTASGTDEIVRIRGGTVRLAVPSVRAGDRVRTRTSDAEIEGAGAYEVIVANDKLTSVRVSTGTAKVIVDGQTIVLSSGETWTAPIVTADLSPSPESSPAPVAPAAGTPAREAPSGAPAEAPARTPSTVASKQVNEAAPRAPRGTTSQHEAARHDETTRRETAPRETAVRETTPAETAPRERTPPAGPALVVEAPPAVPSAPVTSSTEHHFQAGWALLRDHKYSAAADELARAASGTEPLAADARYFQAIALTKAGRAREAETALVAFLDRAPGSTRRGRAAIMLGRLIAARGDTTSARAWFASALEDPDAAVAGAAKAELAKLR